MWMTALVCVCFTATVCLAAAGGACSQPGNPEREQLARNLGIASGLFLALLAGLIVGYWLGAGRFPGPEERAACPPQEALWRQG